VPRLLDLYAGAGGAGLGYRRAGFEVVGVDLGDHAGHYLGGEFLRADVFDLDEEWMAGFDAIHASPPCQAYSVARWSDHHPDLLEPTRELLERVGRPYIIENVPGAPLRHYVTLCGSSFGLEVRRHRRFELSAELMAWAPPPCRHSAMGRPYTITGNPGGRDDLEHHRPARNAEHAAEVMGMPAGLRWEHYREAIPPAYTEWLGREVLLTGLG